jgi:hypothetical protein
MPDTVEHGRIDPNGRNGSVKRVSFSDVARAHHAWDSGAGETISAAREDFEQKLEQFEAASHSEVFEAYWCQKQASAVALARVDSQSAGRLRRVLRRGIRQQEVPDFRLYRETDWVTGEFRELADLLHECDVLALKATYGLERFQRALVMQWLLKVQAHILGYIEWRHTPEPARADPARMGADGETTTDMKSQPVEKPPTQEEKKRRKASAEQLAGFYRRTRRELSKIEDYYQQAGEKRARLHYVEGMIVFGLLALTLAAVASGVILEVFGLLDLERAGVRRFYACMGAGGIGAVVSVLMRMSGRRGGFTIDHELGSFGVRQLGAFRPLIGAVSGVIVAFLVQTPLVPIEKEFQTIEFYVVVAFLAGFSERWTKVVLAGATRTIEKVDDLDVPSPPQMAAADRLDGATESVTSMRHVVRRSTSR